MDEKPYFIRIFYTYMCPHVELKFEDIIFDPKVQTYCRNPEYICPNYGHSWACPPEAPYLEKKVSKYNKFYLIYSQFEIEPYVEQVQAKHPKRSRKRIINSLYLGDEVRDNLENEMKIFLKNHEDEEDKLTLWDGFCRFCYNPVDKKCTFDSGEPCRHPDKIRYSMEAVGIHVHDTVKNAGFSLEWPPKKYLHRFGLVCLK